MIYNSVCFLDTAPFKFIGRTKEHNTSRLLPWSYSGFEFNFRGTGFLVFFNEFNDMQPAYVKVMVDGVGQVYGIADGSETIVIRDLPEGEHHAAVMRVTEGMGMLSVKKVVLMGETPEMGARPDEKPLKLLFIGDSITCGFGVLAPSDVDIFNTYEQDCTATYAYLAAQELDAELCYTGASGKGLVSNSAGDRSDMTLRQAFSYEMRQGGAWDHSKYIPDVVIVNAGTNDIWGGVTEEELSQAALAFQQEIRQAYPKAVVLWLYGMMEETKTGSMAAAVEEMKKTDSNVFFMPIVSVYHDPEEMGALGHPNVKASRRVAPLLAAKIRELLAQE